MWIWVKCVCFVFGTKKRTCQKHLCVKLQFKFERIGFNVGFDRVSNVYFVATLKLFVYTEEMGSLLLWSFSKQYIFFNYLAFKAIRYAIFRESNNTDHSSCPSSRSGLRFPTSSSLHWISQLVGKWHSNRTNFSNYIHFQTKLGECQACQMWKVSKTM